MAEREIFEGNNDSGGITGSNVFNNQFNVLGERLEKLNKEIISVRNCYDYVMREVKKENDNISNLLVWNQKRIKLLEDISDKCSILQDKQQIVYEEMVELIDKNFVRSKI